MEKVEIIFEKEFKLIAGNEFGNKVFEIMVKDEFEKTEKKGEILEIIFPSIIKDVAISFVEGFLIEFRKNHTLQDFDKYFLISGNEQVEKRFNQVRKSR